MKFFNQFVSLTLALQLMGLGAFAQSPKINDSEELKQLEKTLATQKEQNTEIITSEAKKIGDVTVSQSKRYATLAKLRSYEALYLSLLKNSLLPKITTGNKNEDISIQMGAPIVLEASAVGILLYMSNKALVQPGAKAVIAGGRKAATKEVVSAGRTVLLKLDGAITVTLILALAADTLLNGSTAYYMVVNNKDLEVLKTEVFAEVQSLEAELNAMK